MCLYGVHHLRCSWIAIALNDHRGRHHLVQKSALLKEVSPLHGSSFIASPAVPSFSSSSPSPACFHLLFQIPPCNYHLRLQLKATTIKGAMEGERGAVRDGEKGTVEWEMEGGEINETFVHTRTSTCNCTVQRRALENCAGDVTQKREEEGEKETRKWCVCVCRKNVSTDVCLGKWGQLLTVFPLCFALARFLPLGFPVSLSFP